MKYGRTTCFNDEPDFIIRVGTGCGGSVFNTRGSVTSPGYPGNVSRPTDCQWELTVPLGMLIQIDFPGITFSNNIQ